jgi:4-amino-4-deoxy-L-arabinose transferase-like glycosyltransferase
MLKISYEKKFIFLFILIILYRIYILLHFNYGLYFDEAYYWYWSNHLSWGYYSKPPMIAFIIKIFTFFFGNSIYVLKSIPLILHSLTAVIVFLIAKEIFDSKIAFFAGLYYLTMPLISFLSFSISTDAPLLFFWSLTMYSFIKALKNDRLIYWLLTGFFAGMGLLSKYTMIFFLFSFIVYIVVNKKYYLLKNKNVYLAMLIAFIILLPNLIWNYYHHFITFHHTENISEIQLHWFHFKHFFEFFTSQIGVFGPIYFLAYIYYAFKKKNNEFLILMNIYTYTILIFFLVLSFISHAFANWAAPAYISGTIFVTYYLIKNNKYKLYWIALIINLLAMIIFYNFFTFAKIFHVPVTSHTNPFKKMMYWNLTAKKINKYLKKDYFILFDNRKLMSEMEYYLRNENNKMVKLNLSKKWHDQFDMSAPLNNGYVNKSFIYITESRYSGKILSKYFNKIKYLGKVEIPVCKGYKRVYYVFELDKFKGFKKFEKN